MAEMKLVPTSAAPAELLAGGSADGTLDVGFLDTLAVGPRSAYCMLWDRKSSCCFSGRVMPSRTLTRRRVNWTSATGTGRRWMPLMGALWTAVRSFRYFPANPRASPYREHRSHPARSATPSASCHPHSQSSSCRHDTMLTVQHSAATSGR